MVNGPVYISANSVEGFLFPYPCQHLLFFFYLIIANLTGVRWDFSVVLICISFIDKNVEDFCMYLLAIWVFSSEKCVHFSIYLCLYAVYILYYIYWFTYVETSLPSWKKIYLIMVYDLFDVLLDLVPKYFIEDFCIYVHQNDWSVILFFFYILLQFEWVWYCSFLFYFMEKF
jgi:hypothetical protein